MEGPPRQRRISLDEPPSSETARQNQCGLHKECSILTRKDKRAVLAKRLDEIVGGCSARDDDVGTLLGRFPGLFHLKRVQVVVEADHDRRRWTLTIVWAIAAVCHVGFPGLRQTTRTVTHTT